MQGISAGKLRNILHLADEHGCFRMMAIDQRSSMRRMIAKQLTKGEDDVTYDEIALAKYYITKLLSPYSSATLTDPIYGYPNCIAVIPRDVGVLIAYEESPPPKTESGERLLKLINGWSVEKTKRAGANAVKLLVYYNPYASESTREQTHEVVRQVGDECERYDIPYLLEIVVYPLAGVEGKSAEFARQKPDLVIRSTAEFSKPEYKVDILKVPFPAELKFCREYIGAFNNDDFPAVYTLADVRQVCRELNDAAAHPWVILSAGVDIDEFLEDLELAVEAGASGFLCGRAIWKEVMEAFPNVAAMKRILSTEAVENFKRVNAIATRALAWFNHRKFNGWHNVLLADRPSNWFEEY